MASKPGKRPRFDSEVSSKSCRSVDTQTTNISDVSEDFAVGDKTSQMLPRQDCCNNGSRNDINNTFPNKIPRNERARKQSVSFNYNDECDDIRQHTPAHLNHIDETCSLTSCDCLSGNANYNGFPLHNGVRRPTMRKKGPQYDPQGGDRRLTISATEPKHVAGVNGTSINNEPSQFHRSCTTSCVNQQSMQHQYNQNHIHQHQQQNQQMQPLRHQQQQNHNQFSRSRSRPGSQSSLLSDCSHNCPAELTTTQQSNRPMMHNRQNHVDTVGYMANEYDNATQQPHPPRPDQIYDHIDANVLPNGTNKHRFYKRGFYTLCLLNVIFVILNAVGLPLVYKLQNNGDDTPSPTPGCVDCRLLEGYSHNAEIKHDKCCFQNVTSFLNSIQKDGVAQPIKSGPRHAFIHLNPKKGHFTSNFSDDGFKHARVIWESSTMLRSHVDVNKSDCSTVRIKRPGHYFMYSRIHFKLPFDKASTGSFTLGHSVCKVKYSGKDDVLDETTHMYFTEKSNMEHTSILQSVVSLNENDEIYVRLHNTKYLDQSDTRPSPHLFGIFLLSEKQIR